MGLVWARGAHAKKDEALFVEGKTLGPSALQKARIFLDSFVTE